ncbi:sphingosine-1-phosphate lyase 1-like isoform X1 [Anneissia japonica]|uniref:sphingosine-1-phosphate lyase 1-like isoform X1 n=3 Tax=Anneissia japonica TaxID=1529436 RepID=UPI001425838D|nr:sphingosine-1-phosphate lyase 1-like isoform X1 [Anneissia japonica]
MEFIESWAEIGLLYLNNTRHFINDQCSGREAWEIILATVLLINICHWLYQQVFLHELSVFERMKLSFFKILRRLPVIGRKIQEELEKTKSAITKDMFPLPQGDIYNTHLPEQGIPKDELLNLVTTKYKSMEKIDWQGGRLSGAVYNCGAEHESLMERIYGIFVGDNLLHPDVFPGTRKMEAEVVAMCCNFFHGGPEACGTMTSGGTESILMACKAYREHAYKRGIKYPEILAPCSGHAAFAKAAKYFKMRYVETPIDPTTKLINIPAMKRKISKNTCMLVVSAPSFPYGVVEQVEEVGKLGKHYNIPVHVDACMGGFIIPFAKRAGINLPPMDFRVEGVTSISADAHKYGLAPKGNSIVVYKNPEYRMGQFYINTDWCGGIYASPAVGGTRSGAVIATCWATMMYVGADGYQENAVKIIKTREYVEDCVRNIPGLTVQGKPDVNILSISSDTFDIYRLGAALTNKGWHMFTVQYPAGVNFCVTKMHTLPGVAEGFVKDLEECTADIMKDPNAKADGIAAIYGMAESIPDRSMVAEFVQGYLEAYYSTKL